MLAVPGGIDMNHIEFQHQDSGESVQFDPAMLQFLKAQDISGFFPVITGFARIKSPLSVMWSRNEGISGFIAVLISRRPVHTVEQPWL